jgi:AhpC/TSA family
MKKLLMTSALLVCAWGASAAERLSIFEPDSMARIVSEHKGKPFVLIVWSLDCEYCQASLAALAKEKRKRKDLDVVTLSTDSAGDPQASALMKKKLGGLGMSDHAWAFGSAPPEQLRYVIDPKWHGEMPRSYWFDARGEKLAHSGVVTAETIRKFSAN